MKTDRRLMRDTKRILTGLTATAITHKKNNPPLDEASLPMAMEFIAKAVRCGRILLVLKWIQVVVRKVSQWKKAAVPLC